MVRRSVTKDAKDRRRRRKDAPKGRREDVQRERAFFFWTKDDESDEKSSSQGLNFMEVSVRSPDSSPTQPASDSESLSSCLNQSNRNHSLAVLQAAVKRIGCGNEEDSIFHGSMKCQEKLQIGRTTYDYHNSNGNGDNHLITAYFGYRRSSRKTAKAMLLEKQKRIEDALLSASEEGFEVRTTKEKGRGVYTKKALKRGEFVLEYAGELVDSDEARRRELRYAGKNDIGCYMYYFKYLDKQYCIDATEECPRLGRLVNHSKKCNLKTQIFAICDEPHLVLIACRDIAAGEELLYDYGDRSKLSLHYHPWLAM